jgi:hypothetical protein
MDDRARSGLQVSSCSLRSSLSPRLAPHRVPLRRHRRHKRRCRESRCHGTGCSRKRQRAYGTAGKNLDDLITDPCGGVTGAVGGLLLDPARNRDPWLLNVHNGTLDLRTGTLRPHRRDDYITKLGPVTFDPAAKCPSWHEYLARVTAADETLISYICKASGMALTGAVQDHSLFFLYGTGANGKSTYVNTMQAMLGPDFAMKAPPDLLLAKSNDAHPTDWICTPTGRSARCLR